MGQDTSQPMKVSNDLYWQRIPSKPGVTTWILRSRNSKPIELEDFVTC